LKELGRPPLEVLALRHWSRVYGWPDPGSGV
jgi:hypothetical protein